MAGSPLSVALDPRVDEAVVQEQMQGEPPAEQPPADAPAEEPPAAEEGGKPDDGLSTQREASN
jgi:hypothetical protein